MGVFQEEDSDGYKHATDRCAGHSSGWRRADLAVQQELGVLSQWSSWVGHAHSLLASSYWPSVVFLVLGCPE